MHRQQRVYVLANMYLEHAYSPVLPSNLMGIEEGFASSGPSMVSAQQPMKLRMPSRPRPSMPVSMPSTPATTFGSQMNPIDSQFGNQQQPLLGEVGIYSQPPQPQISAVSTSFGSQPSMNAWELPIQFIPATGPVDAILIGVLDRQRSLAQSGATGQQLMGPLNPRLDALVNSERSNEIHPVSSVLTNLVQRTALRRLAEKVAAIFVIYRLCQWQILPSPETFSNIPEWYRPRSSQFFTPHPIWASQIAWGMLRDIVINEQDRYATMEFQHVFLSSLNVNWPYGDNGILQFEGTEVTLTPAFEAHIMNFSNWSVDDAFQMRYPELRDACKFTGQQ